MGLRIGNIPNALFAGRVEMRTDVSARLGEESTPKLGMTPSKSEERVGAGFGKNTISIPGLAARTVGRNMNEARKMVPTLEELREKQEARADERRTQAREDLEARRQALEEHSQQPVIRIDFQRAESRARAQARQFINSVNEAAGQARARVEGTEPPSRGSQASIQIGGQAFSFSQPASAQFDLRG